VRGFLHRGELVGVNLARSLSGRPMWRITPDAVAAFEKQRASAQVPKQRPKKTKKQSMAVDYYPD
jgi:hypothetical protein